MRLPWAEIDPRAAWREFHQHAGGSVHDEILGYFAERAALGTATRPRVIACSLFCKPVDLDDSAAMASPDEMRRRPVRNGACTWWEAYAAPLLRNLRRLPYTFPEHEAHVYLAADLDWLADALCLPQVVVHVMQHSSLAACPGMLWRFLAHDLPDVEEVINVDAEDEWTDFGLSRRLGEWRESGLGLYRHMNPQEWDPTAARLLTYRPLVGCHFAYRPRQDLSMREAVCGFAWLAAQGRVPTTTWHPTQGEVPMFGHRWPNYGMDETFLQHVFYPAMLERGVYTNFNVSHSPVMFALDLFAAARAHPGAIVTQGV
jgi:hypothetical protein